jgi:hypothetical protein
LSLPKEINTNINVRQNGYTTVGNIGAEIAEGGRVIVRERGEGAKLWNSFLF